MEGEREKHAVVRKGMEDSTHFPPLEEDPRGDAAIKEGPEATTENWGGEFDRGEFR